MMCFNYEGDRTPFPPRSADNSISSDVSTTKGVRTPCPPILTCSGGFGFQLRRGSDPLPTSMGPQGSHPSVIVSTTKGIGPPSRSCMNSRPRGTVNPFQLRRGSDPLHATGSGTGFQPQQGFQLRRGSEPPSRVETPRRFRPRCRRFNYEGDRNPPSRAAE